MRRPALGRLRALRFLRVLEAAEIIAQGQGPSVDEVMANIGVSRQLWSELCSSSYCTTRIYFTSKRCHAREWNHVFVPNTRVAKSDSFTSREFYDEATPSVK